YDTMLTIHRMRRGQQLAGWFAPQHIAPGPSLEHESRVGLSALELLDLQVPREALHMVAQIALQIRDVEAMPLRNRHRAAEIVVHVSQFPLQAAARIPPFAARGGGAREPLISHARIG